LLFLEHVRDTDPRVRHGEVPKAPRVERPMIVGSRTTRVTRLGVLGSAELEGDHDF
jgi:hypothetical protein